jgi:hypothetical protein
MNIVGKGKKVMDADLLARLAVDTQSGGTVSKAEVKKAIDGAVRELKDEFAWRDSSRGITRARDAIANTFQFAIDKGFVRGGSAKDMIEAFLDGSGKTNLAEVKKDIESEIRSNRSSGGGYGGSSSSVSYGGGSYSHYGT